LLACSGYRSQLFSREKEEFSSENMWVALANISWGYVWFGNDEYLVALLLYFRSVGFTNEH
jgi:hypothetical protein